MLTRGLVKDIPQYLRLVFVLSLLALATFVYKVTPSVSTDAICSSCNVILITMTNLRYDHVSSNGYSRPTTPNLDELAKESLVFDSAFGHSSWTLPEGISIYTGLYPYEHGVMNRYDGSTLSTETPTLIDIFKKNGYKTAAFTGGFDYNPEFGLTNRFDEYQECAKGQNNNYPRQSGPRVDSIAEYGELNCTILGAVGWLKKNSKSKFFLHVQGFDAHCPYSQEGGKMYDPGYAGEVNYSACLWTFDRSDSVIKDGKEYYPVYSAATGIGREVLLGEDDIYHLVALYDESITLADKQIGIFLKEIEKLGLSKDTIIIFTSEHGDMFGKHGRFMRGGPLRGTFYDDVLHVPLMIKYPEVLPKRVSGLIQHIDLFPTILEFLGLQTQSKTSGESLVPLILESREVNQYIYAGSEFNPIASNIYFSERSRTNVIRNKEWKLIEETVFDKEIPSKTVELYNIVSDKEETNNLAEKEKDALSELKIELSKWLDELDVE